MGILSPMARLQVMATPPPCCTVQRGTAGQSIGASVDQAQGPPVSATTAVTEACSLL